MAVLSINIPDAIAPRVRDAYCTATGYSELVPNPNYDSGQPLGPSNLDFIPNPVPKMTWVKMKILDHIRDAVKTVEMQAFDQTQRQDRQTEAQAIDQALNLS
jgi:hypothetical protein